MRWRSPLVAGTVFAALCLGAAPWGSSVLKQARAQNFGQREVNGVVVDGGSAVVSGATVFLRNTKTKSIRSYTTPADGKFRFAQVNMSDDYDLWAEKDGKKSATRTVSTWDTRKDYECELKIK